MCRQEGIIQLCSLSLVSILYTNLFHSMFVNLSKCDYICNRYKMGNSIYASDLIEETLFSDDISIHERGVPLPSIYLDYRKVPCRTEI